MSIITSMLCSFFQVQTQGTNLARTWSEHSLGLCKTGRKVVGGGWLRKGLFRAQIVPRRALELAFLKPTYLHIKTENNSLKLRCLEYK